MTTRNDLKEVRTLADEIASLKRRRSSLLLDAMGTTQNLTGMPRSGQQHDRFAEMAAKIDSIDEQLIKKIAEREEALQRIDNDVKRLPEQQRRVIVLRYYERMSWNKIAYYTHYSIDHCGKIERAAVRNLANMTDNDGFKSV